MPTTNTRLEESIRPRFLRVVRDMYKKPIVAGRGGCEYENEQKPREMCIDNIQEMSATQTHG